MRIFKTIGYGLIIWNSLFIVVLILMTFRINFSLVLWPIVWLTTIALAWYFSLFLKLTKWREALSTGLIWVIIAFVLDFFLTVQFAGLQLFKQGDIWAEYALTILIPLIFVFTRKK